MVKKTIGVSFQRVVYSLARTLDGYHEVAHGPGRGRGSLLLRIQLTSVSRVEWRGRLFHDAPAWARTRQKKSSPLYQAGTHAGFWHAV